jgi:hypothetical protein
VPSSFDAGLVETTRRGLDPQREEIRQPLRRKSMLGVYLKSAVAGAFLLGMATAAMAVTGEFGNRCTMGLALGKDVQTDCSVNAQLQGKTYCFFNKVAMTEFMKDPTGNLGKAQAYYSKM